MGASLAGKKEHKGWILQNPDDAREDVHLRINGGRRVWPGAYGDSDVENAEEICSLLVRYPLDGRIGE